MQSLIKTATATWTEPAAPETRRRLRLLRDLEERAGEEADPAQQEQIDLLRKEIGQAEQIRITVRTATVIDVARQRQKIREALQYLEETLEDGDPLFGVLFGALRVWAAAAIIVSEIESRTAPRWDLDAGKWKKQARPDWLESPAAFVETVPDLLVAALDEAIEAANPGIFGAPSEPDDETKKNGGASASA